MNSTTVNRIHSPLRVAGHLLGGQAAVVGCSLIVNVLSARAMGPAGRGRVAFVLQLSYLLTTLAAAGVDRAYPALAPSNQRFPVAMTDVRRMIAPSVAVLTAVCLLFGMTSGHLSMLVYATATAGVVVGNIAVLMVRSAGVAAGSGRSFLRVSLVGQVTMVAVAVALAITRVQGPVWWLIGYAICLALPPLLSCRFEPSPPDRFLQARVRRLGLRLLPAGVANMIVLRADRLVLPLLASYRDLGVYVVVATLTELVVWPAQSYVDANVPAWRRATLAGTLRRGRIVIGVAGFAIGAALVVVLAGSMLVVPLFGAAYRGAIPLLWPLAAAAVLYAVSRVCVGFAVAAEKPRAVLATDATAMIIALSAYLLLIPRFGAMGAALGSLLGYGTAATVALTFTVRGRS